MLYFEDTEVYKSALLADYKAEEKYFATIGRSFVDLEFPKEPLPFRILDVCMCTKNDQLFFQYRAMDMSSFFKRKDINAINDCHFTPCKEVFESPDFQFLPDQSNFNNEVDKNWIHLIFLSVRLL